MVPSCVRFASYYMINYIKYKNGIRVDMMGNYHGGCQDSCCRNSWGYPTKKGVQDNCKVKITK